MADMEAMKYQIHEELGGGPEDFVRDFGLSGDSARFVMAGRGGDPDAWAQNRASRFAAEVSASTEEVSHTLRMDTPERTRAHSLALSAVAQANEMGVSGHESSETMLKNLNSRARKIVYDTLDDEFKKAGGSLDLQELKQRLTQLAESAIDSVVRQTGSAMGVDASPGQLGSQLHQSLQLDARKQGGAFRQLYDQDEMVRRQVDALGDIGDVMKRGGVFDRDDGSQVRLRGSDGGRGGFGGGGDDEGRPNYRSAYGPIRAWYAMHAMRGVMDMTLGQSMASMAGAEEFERNLAVSAGEGPGPIASLMTRQANQQMFAGIAAEQQFGWLNEIPQDLFGGIGGQRMYQASRFAAGLGMSGSMANALIGMSGGKPIEGLGWATAGLGAGYLALAGFAEVSGREGVGEVVNEAMYRGKQFMGWGAAATGKLLGRSNEDILNNYWVRLGMSAEPPEVDRGLLSQMETQYENVSDLGLDVQSTASVAAQLTRMYGTEAPTMFMRGMQPTDDAAMAFARAARDAGVDADALVKSSFAYAQQREGPGMGRAQFAAMWEYARQSPEQQFYTDQWTQLSEQGRSALIQSGMSVGSAWDQVQAAFPNLTPSDVPQATQAAQLSGMGYGYGWDLSVTEANRLVGGISPIARDAMMDLAGPLGQAAAHQRYGEATFQGWMTQLRGYDDKQLGAIGQLAQSFTGSGVDVGGMFRMLPEYAQANTFQQARVREMVGMGGQFGIGAGWINLGAVTGLTEQQYGLYSSFLGQAYQGGGVPEIAGLSRTAVSAFGGLQGNQLGYAATLLKEFQSGAGLSWTDAATQGSQIAGTVNNGYQMNQYLTAYEAALGTGASPEAAIQYGTQAIGTSGNQYRDLMGVLKGDPWSLARLAQRDSSAPPPLDRPEYRHVQMAGTTVVLAGAAASTLLPGPAAATGQQWQQFNASSAMQWGGQFFNPMTGQNQNIQYGTQDISDALFDISTRQQRDNLDYQSQSMNLSNRYQQQGMQSNWQQTQTRFQWRMSDWNYQENVNPN